MATQEGNYSRVTLLLGAGASVDAGCPTVKDLVARFDHFLAEIGDGQAIEGARWLTEQISKTPAIVEEAQVLDIELLLSTIVQLMDRRGSVLDPFVSQWQRGVRQYAAVLPLILKLLQDHIRKECTVRREDVEYLWPVGDFAERYGKLDVFTLNYDASIEMVCQQRDIRYTDGFDLYWNPMHFESPLFRVRLFKLHGSLLWYETDSAPRKLVKIPVQPTSDGVFRFFTEEPVSNLLMYPAFVKRQHIDPYATLMDHLRRALQESRVLIVIGCSFRDEYLKELIIEKMLENLDLQLVVVDPNGAGAVAHSDKVLGGNWKFSAVSSRISFVHAPARVALAGRQLLDRARRVEELPDLKLLHQSAVLSGQDKLVQSDFGTPSAVNYVRALIDTRSLGALAEIAADISDAFSLREVALRLITKANVSDPQTAHLTMAAWLIARLSPFPDERILAHDWFTKKISWALQYTVWRQENAYRTITCGDGKPAVDSPMRFFLDHAYRVRHLEAEFLPWVQASCFDLPENFSRTATAILDDLDKCATYFERSAQDPRHEWFTGFFQDEVRFPRGLDDALMRELATRFNDTLPISVSTLV